jgi:hypothetical protein
MGSKEENLVIYYRNFHTHPSVFTEGATNFTSECKNVNFCEISQKFLRDIAKIYISTLSFRFLYKINT